jgi:lipopolysaccharide biosynthesis regulator YciM
LFDQKAALEEGIQEDIKAMRHQAQMYLLKNQPNNALPYFEMLLQADGNSPGIILECADFFQNYGMSERAVHLFQKVVELPNADNQQKAKATETINSLTLKKD